MNSPINQTHEQLLTRARDQLRAAEAVHHREAARLARLTSAVKSANRGYYSPKKWRSLDAATARVADAASKVNTIRMLVEELAQ